MSLAGSWQVVEAFERRFAEYVGAPHAVAVDTCTAGLGLCFRLLKASTVEIPRRTYLGVACAVVHSGAKLMLRDRSWKGSYGMFTYADSCWGSRIVDSACRLRRGCWEAGSTTCFSFQYRKHLKIGRGGMVCTGDLAAAEWLRRARFCGRSEVNGPPHFVGFHCFMEPERAARGLVLMDSLPDDNPDLEFSYPDLREYTALKGHLL